MNDSPNELSQLRAVIRSRLGCDSVFRGGTVVREQFTSDDQVYRVTVYGFDLVDHPESSKCYVWPAPIEGREAQEYVIVPHSEQVDSPRAAVRAHGLGQS